jgi:hypothetical protein
MNNGENKVISVTITEKYRNDKIKNVNYFVQPGTYNAIIGNYGKQKLGWMDLILYAEDRVTLDKGWSFNFDPIQTILLKEVEVIDSITL